MKIFFVFWGYVGGMSLVCLRRAALSLGWPSLVLGQVLALSLLHVGPGVPFIAATPPEVTTSWHWSS